MHNRILFSTCTSIIALTLIISLLSGYTIAQNPNLMPPVPIPQPNEVKADTQIRILDARLTNIGPSHVFEFTFEPYLWIGIDADGNQIKYNYPQGSEVVEQTPATEFIRYSRDLTAYAYIYLDYSMKPIVRKRIQIQKADEPMTYKLGLISANLRILPGIYKINIEILINSQTPKNRDYIWIEENQLNIKNFLETVRISPKRVPKIESSAVIVITRYQDSTYEYMRVGNVNYYSNAIERVENISKLKEQIDKLIKQRKDGLKKLEENETPEDNVITKRLLPVIQRKKIELMEAQFFKTNIIKIKKELAEAKEAQDKFNKFLTEYNNGLRALCEDIATDIQNLYMEMWWTGNLCLPKWTPHEKYGTLEDLRKKWKISRFLSGKLDTEEVKGQWKKEEWIKWVKEEWMPKIDSINEKFRKFFGDQSLAEEHRWYYGLTENMYQTFWSPKNERAYEEMKKLITQNYLKNYGMAVGNLLAHYHAEDKKNVEYSFVDEKYGKPVPGPFSFKTYFDKLKDTRRMFLKAFAPDVDPTKRPDPKEIKKRKYYVSKNGVYVGPLEYDPVTGEKNDGPYDESILNPKGDVGEN